MEGNNDIFLADDDALGDLLMYEEYSMAFF